MPDITMPLKGEVPFLAASFGPRFAIGGEFETNFSPALASNHLARLTHGITGSWSPNGRTSLAQILRDLIGKGVHHIHLPAYICDSVLQPVKLLGLKYSFYPVDCDLVAHPDPPANAAVLLVHYFGRINPAAAALRRESGSHLHLIEDACQALLSDWHSPQSDNIHYLISPRKFAEIPMGGWSNVRAEGAISPQQEQLAWQSFSARQVKANYLRDSDGPVDENFEQSYLTAFEEVEESFSAIDPDAALPAWVLDLIAGHDWEATAKKRSENHLRLMAELSPALKSPTHRFEENEVPLGHLIRVKERDRLKRKLMSERIFCPVHWPLPAEVSDTSFPDAHELSRHGLTLPIDHRYGSAHMEILAQTVNANI